MNRADNMDFLCFGGEDWWYHNHGHIDFQLMRRFAKRGITLYVNSIIMQKPGISQGRKFVQRFIRKGKSIFKGLKKTNAGFWVYSPFSLPVHHIPVLRFLNDTILQSQINRVMHKLKIHKPLIWVACPTACNIALKFEKHCLVYQRTDRFEEYPDVDVDTIRQYDQRLKCNADLVIYVNYKLYEEEKKQCKKAIYLDHGVDYEMFVSAEQDIIKPVDIAGIQRPIAGYFGSIDSHKFDTEFMEKVVDLLPEVSFVFIGETLLDCSKLLSKKNVWMLGQKPYKQIPHYGKCFDVAIMTSNQNRWIEACNPIKLKEYLALGKPVVSIPFPELEKYEDVVYQANTPEKFAKYIKKSLAEDNPERIASRRNKVSETTWDKKAQIVLETLFGKNDDYLEESL